MSFSENEKQLRANFCPKCDNEDISEIAVFCILCGTPLFNYCSDEKCNHLNSIYAYFCELCGEPTIYNQDGIVIKLPENDD
jgi:hypothetical protein